MARKMPWGLSDHPQVQKTHKPLCWDSSSRPSAHPGPARPQGGHPDAHSAAQQPVPTPQAAHQRGPGQATALSVSRHGPPTRKELLFTPSRQEGGKSRAGRAEEVPARKDPGAVEGAWRGSGESDGGCRRHGLWDTAGETLRKHQVPQLWGGKESPVTPGVQAGTLCSVVTQVLRAPFCPTLAPRTRAHRHHPRPSKHTQSSESRGPRAGRSWGTETGQAGPCFPVCSWWRGFLTSNSNHGTWPSGDTGPSPFLPRHGTFLLLAPSQEPRDPEVARTGQDRPCCRFLRERGNPPSSGKATGVLWCRDGEGLGPKGGQGGQVGADALTQAEVWKETQCKLD